MMARLEKAGGDSSDASIKRRAKRGEGANAEVHGSRLTIKSGERAKSITLVEKQFKSENDEGLTPQELAQRSFRIYKHLRELGLPVPPTYRLDAARGRIYMTDVARDGMRSITTNDLNTLTKPFVTDISNFADLIEEIARCCIVAAENGVVLASDAYNFATPVTGSGAIRLYLTDLELISDASISAIPGRNLSAMRTANFESARAFLEGFVEEAIVPEQREEYREEVRRLQTFR